MSTRQGTWWLPLALFLALAASSGAFLLISKLQGNQPLQILLPTPTPSSSRQVYIGGAVNRPGLYSAQDTDQLRDLLQAAGGPTTQADLNLIRVYIPKASESTAPQKININTAEPWLLEALPGIGPQLAKSIVNYRQQNGPYRTIQDITKVPGISRRILERIGDRITVGD